MRTLRSSDTAVDDVMASLRVNPSRWTTVNSFAVLICRVTASKSGPLVEGGLCCGDGLDASQAIEINTIPRRFILSTSLRCEQPASSRYRAERPGSATRATVVRIATQTRSRGSLHSAGWAT